MSFCINFTAQINLQAILYLMGIEIFWFRHNLLLWQPFKDSTRHCVKLSVLSQLLVNFGTNTSSSYLTAKSPEAQNLIPMAISLLVDNQCSCNNHNHMSVLADEPLAKQYCTITQNILMKTSLLLSFWLDDCFLGPHCYPYNYKRLCPVSVSGHFIISDLNAPSQYSDTDLYIWIPPARAVAWIYIFKYNQPGQEDGILNHSTGSAREEDMAIAMSRFSFKLIFHFIVAQWLPSTYKNNRQLSTGGS